MNWILVLCIAISLGIGLAYILNEYYKDGVYDI